MGHQPRSYSKPGGDSIEEARAHAVSKYQSALRTTRVAVAFAVIWPVLATVLFFMGSFSLFNVATSYLAPMGMLGMMWIAGSIPRDGLWRMVRGTMVFEDAHHNQEEVMEWVNSTYGSDRVHRFTNKVYIFRYKRDAALFKLMWG